jgi:hypothetical protein
MPLVTNDQHSPSGITNASPVPIVPAPIETVRVSTDDIKTPVVDTKWIPRSSLLTHIGGSSWIVDYYSQVLDTDSNLSGQQYTKNPVYQSYKKINNLEIKVQTPLSTDQDDASKEMNVTGSGTLYPSVIPNEGDMFVADIGEGKNAVFRITSTRKNSIFKEACYDISYVLDTDNLDKQTDLDQKTIITYYFHKDFLYAGSNPLVIKTDMDTLVNIKKVYDIMLYQYFKRFYSNEFKTLVVPSQLKPTYDTYLSKYILDMFSTSEANELAYMKLLNLDEDRVSRCDSLWDALKYKDISLLNTAFRKIGLVSSLTFNRTPTFNGVRYSGIGAVVYPKDPYLTVDHTYVNNVKVVEAAGLQPSADSESSSNILVRAINLRNLNSDLGDSLYPVTVDDYYVLSENFYNNTQQQSTLETAVNAYLNNSQVDIYQLYNTAKTFHSWGSLEQFYYVPIIMTLIKSVLKGI